MIAVSCAVIALLLAAILLAVVVVDERQRKRAPGFSFYAPRICEQLRDEYDFTAERETVPVPFHVLMERLRLETETTVEMAHV